MWPDGTHPMLFVELSCVCMPGFRFVVSILFFFFFPWQKYHFWLIFNIERGVTI